MMTKMMVRFTTVSTRYVDYVVKNRGFLCFSYKNLHRFAIFP